MRIQSVFMLLILASALQAEFRPLLITLDHNDDFVITGDGQSTGGIKFSGPVGSLEKGPGSVGALVGEEIVGAAPAPFQFALGVSSGEVTYGALGGAIINGSFPLQFGPTDVSLIDQIEVEVGYAGRPAKNPFGLICDDCLFPSVQRTPGGGIEVSNINDPIINLTIFSKDGSFTVTGLPVGVSVVDSVPGELTLTKPDGFSPDSLLDLDIFAGISSSQPVFAQFTLADETSFGPFQVAAAVPEPAGCLPMAFGMAIVAMRWRRRRNCR